MPTIEFLIEKKKIKVGKYANLRQAALKHDIDVYVGVDRLANCRGHGACGTCTMEIVEGLQNLNPKTRLEQFHLKDRPENIRLSCQTEVRGDICVVTNFKPKPPHQ
ncbi:MAG: (2Fe-2S)-binding protein [Verrucomicrobia bacterium]|nr:(2Fe-2S)-binding protein [Verrucomicrobiota bacterium]